MLCIFAIPKQDGKFFTGIEEGSIAQLVQSVCLTSRGSGVRLPLLPPEKASGRLPCRFAGDVRSVGHFPDSRFFPSDV